MKLILSVYLLGLLALASAMPYMEVEDEFEEEAYAANEVLDPEAIMMQQDEPGPAVSQDEGVLYDALPPTQPIGIRIPACINKLVIMGFTSNVPNAGADAVHGVELRAGGLTRSVNLPNRPGNDYFPNKGDLWIIGLSSFNFPRCMPLEKFQNIAIVARNNDGWNIASIVTLMCSRRRNDCHLFSQDFGVNRWIDGNGPTSQRRFDLTRV